MSSMLEQAIVDAKALKEAALKNAEQAVIDKYSLKLKLLLRNYWKEVILTRRTIQEEVRAPLAADPEEL